MIFGTKLDLMYQDQLKKSNNVSQVMHFNFRADRTMSVNTKEKLMLRSISPRMMETDGPDEIARFEQEYDAEKERTNRNLNTMTNKSKTVRSYSEFKRGSL